MAFLLRYMLPGFVLAGLYFQIGVKEGMPVNVVVWLALVGWTWFVMWCLEPLKPKKKPPTSLEHLRHRREP